MTMLNKQHSRIFLYSPPVSSHKLQYSHVRIEIILTILKAMCCVFMPSLSFPVYCVKKSCLSLFSLFPVSQTTNQAEKRLTTDDTITYKV